MAWRRLDQKVSMIFIQTNFDKSDPVITFAYALAYLHERFLYRLCKYRPTVFCWAHKVVKKIAHIVRSMHIDTFRHPESAPRPCFFSIIVSFHGRGQVAASRGECIPKSFMPIGNPIETEAHDFKDPNSPTVAPYGIYDIANNEGFVNVGIISDTAVFAVNSIRGWWYSMGGLRFSNATNLYITADGGGSNSSRSRLWKKELQGLADELLMPIEVSHFPPGTSKWNKIEHRLFSYITKNWRGRPLETIEIVLSLIASTTTKTGLVVNTALDLSEYETGIKVTDEELKNVNITQNPLLGDWNYIIHPHW